MTSHFAIFRDQSASPKHALNTFTSTPCFNTIPTDTAYPPARPPMTHHATSSSDFHPFAQPQNFLPIGTSKQPAPRFNEDIFLANPFQSHGEQHKPQTRNRPTPQTHARRLATTIPAVQSPRGSVVIPEIRKGSNVIYDLLRSPPEDVSTTGPSAFRTSKAPAQSRETRILSLYDLKQRASITFATRKESSTLGELNNTSVRKESGTLPDRGIRGEREGSFTYSELGEIYPYRASWLRGSQYERSVRYSGIGDNSDRQSRYSGMQLDEDYEGEEEWREPARRDSDLTIPGIRLEDIWPDYNDLDLEPDMDEQGVDLGHHLKVDVGLEAELRKESWDISSLSLFPSPPDRESDTECGGDDDSLHTSSTSTHATSLGTPQWQHATFAQHQHLYARTHIMTPIIRRESEDSRCTSADSRDGHLYHQQRHQTMSRHVKGKASTATLKRVSEVSAYSQSSEEDTERRPDLDLLRELELLRLPPVGDDDDDFNGRAEDACEVRTIMGIPPTPISSDAWRGFWSEPPSPSSPEGPPRRKMSEAQRIRDAYLQQGMAGIDNMNRRRPSII